MLSESGDVVMYRQRRLAIDYRLVDFAVIQLRDGSMIAEIDICEAELHIHFYSRAGGANRTATPHQADRLSG